MDNKIIHKIRSYLCYNKTSYSPPEVAAISKTEKRYHLVGWLLFLLCAVFFIVQSLTDNNLLGLGGSIIFFGGCIAFLIPLVSNWRK